MKKELVFYAGNYWWNYFRGLMCNENKNGKFFHGIDMKFGIQKGKGYTDLGFRICKRITK